LFNAANQRDDHVCAAGLSCRDSVASDHGPIQLVRNVAFKGPGANLLTLSGDSDLDGVPDLQLFRIDAGVTMEDDPRRGRRNGGAVSVGPTAA